MPCLALLTHTDLRPLNRASKTQICDAKNRDALISAPPHFNTTHFSTWRMTCAEMSSKKSDSAPAVSAHEKMTCVEMSSKTPVSVHVKWPVLKCRQKHPFQHKPFYMCWSGLDGKLFEHRSNDVTFLQRLVYSLSRQWGAIAKHSQTRISWAFARPAQTFLGDHADLPQQSRGPLACVGSRVRTPSIRGAISTPCWLPLALTGSLLTGSHLSR